MKICSRCRRAKSRDAFNRASRNTDGLHSYCRECQHAHYLSNRLRHGRNVRRNERARRARFREYIAGELASGCADCGERDIRVLEFDHIRGVKVAAVSALMRDASFEKLKAEIAKCEVRCSNCHALATLRRRGGSWHDRFLPPRDEQNTYQRYIVAGVTHSETLESLLVSSNRLIRLAAQATGNSTPSAVWRTLSILDGEGAMRVGELALASRVSQPGMTRLLGGMVDDGLVSRAADSDDSRAWLIDITPAGHEALVRWRRQLSDTLEPWFRSLDDEGWATLERAVAIIGSRTSTEAVVR
jgi:DNA-binding MarR family transcriptional regulator